MGSGLAFCSRSTAQAFETSHDGCKMQGLTPIAGPVCDCPDLLAVSLSVGQKKTAIGGFFLR